MSGVTNDTQSLIKVTIVIMKLKTVLLIGLCLVMNACSTLNKIQSNAMDKVNSVKDDALVQVGAKNKHDLLLERLEETVALQEETKQYLLEAYDVLSGVSDDVTELDAQIETLTKTYEQSEDVATNLKKQMKAVDRLAKGLFIEWRRELRQYDNKNLRAKSAENLKKTKQQYQALYAAMKKSYQSVTPLLSLLHDNQLYLKHNRSSVAMQGFQQEVESAGTHMDSIVEDIELSIEESQAFAEVINVH